MSRCANHPVRKCRRYAETEPEPKPTHETNSTNKSTVGTHIKPSDKSLLGTQTEPSDESIVGTQIEPSDEALVGTQTEPTAGDAADRNHCR